MPFCLSVQAPFLVFELLLLLEKVSFSRSRQGQLVIQILNPFPLESRSFPLHFEFVFDLLASSTGEGARRQRYRLRSGDGFRG